MKKTHSNVLLSGSIRKINDYWVFWPCSYNKLEGIKVGLPHWVEVRKGFIHQLNRITENSYNTDILLLADISNERVKGLDGVVTIQKIVGEGKDAECKPTKASQAET